MNRKLFIIALFMCCLFPSILLQAQTKKALPRHAISVEPLYLLNGGLRLNLEKKLSPTDWIELNLTGYWLPHRDLDPNYYGDQHTGGYWISNADFHRISKLSGFGIGATYKYYLFSFFMINPSLSFTRYNVESSVYDFVPYKEDGLNFYEYIWTYKQRPFHRLTSQFTISLRTPSKNPFFLEHYVGFGYAYSFYDKSTLNYNQTMFGYGYRGYIITLGLKLGFNMR